MVGQLINNKDPIKSQDQKESAPPEYPFKKRGKSYSLIVLAVLGCIIGLLVLVTRIVYLSFLIETTLHQVKTTQQPERYPKISVFNSELHGVVGHQVMLECLVHSG